MKKTLLVFGFGLLGLASCKDATGNASEQAATEQVAEVAAEEAVAEEDYLEKMSESFFYSGYGNLWVEKGRNMAKYDSTFFESIAPVTGFIEDLLEIVTTPIKLMTNDEAEMIDAH